jgi:hypothetical protein
MRDRASRSSAELTETDRRSRQDLVRLAAPAPLHLKWDQQLYPPVGGVGGPTPLFGAPAPVQLLQLGLRFSSQVVRLDRPRQRNGHPDLFEVAGAVGAALQVASNRRWSRRRYQPRMLRFARAYVPSRAGLKRRRKTHLEGALPAVHPAPSLSAMPSRAVPHRSSSTSSAASFRSPDRIGCWAERDRSAAIHRQAGPGSLLAQRSKLIVTTKANGNHMDVFRVGWLGQLSPSSVVMLSPAP